MSITTCPTCSERIHWSWEEAFDKFGFGDGDSLVMTEHVANTLRRRGYTVATEPWGCHNVTISSIKSRKGRELIPDDIVDGYDDPRSYLPRSIVRLLDEAFPSDKGVPL